MTATMRLILSHQVKTTQLQEHEKESVRKLIDEVRNMLGIYSDDRNYKDIAIINNKKIEQFGIPKELFEQPNSLYVANFLNKINKLPSNLLKELGAKTYEKNVLNRGRHFPKDIMQNKQMLDMRRAQIKQTKE